MLTAAILGVSGYTGYQLFCLLEKHPCVEVRWVTSEKYRGKDISSAYRMLCKKTDIQCFSISDIDHFPKVDVVFSCLPSGVSMFFVKKIFSRDMKVIDLSADFRLQDVNLYKTLLGYSHSFPELLKEARYGFPEFNRQRILDAVLVANPGCYATCALAGMLPLLRADLELSDVCTIDIKSPVSGRGRAPREEYNFSEMNQQITVDRDMNHFQKYEVQQHCLDFSGRWVCPTFLVNNMPLSRGLMVTLYFRIERGITPKDVQEVFDSFYKQEQFIRVLEPGMFPSLKSVCYSNYLDIGFSIQDSSLIVVSVVDNLYKGASGQAIQNMNIMLGLEENKGLTDLPIFV